MAMRFLADESCDAMIVRALQDAGHDITAVRDIVPRAPDSVVIDLARRDVRILLTEDRDFGQLVYASGSPHCGVVLLRYPFVARTAIARALVELPKRATRFWVALSSFSPAASGSAANRTASEYKLADVSLNGCGMRDLSSSPKG